MADAVVYIPISANLYKDVIRFSDGAIDPAHLAERMIHDWIESEIETTDVWGERWEEVAKIYAPENLKRVLARRELEDSEAIARRKPLVWKEITIRAGSDVRMMYGGISHFAKAQNGKIVDETGEYSPSEWASKVANGTARNAWRDLWFREPGAAWVRAETLREQVLNDRS
jgi:hypothetical protein